MISRRSPSRAIAKPLEPPDRRRPTAAAGRTTRSRARRAAPRAAARIGRQRERTRPMPDEPTRRTDPATSPCRSGTGTRERWPRTARRTPPAPDARPDDDLGREHPVDRPLEPLEVDLVPRSERRHLPPSVHPGIRPPGDRQLRRAPRRRARGRPTARPRRSADPRCRPTRGTRSRRTRARPERSRPGVWVTTVTARGRGPLGRRRASQKHRGACQAQRDAQPEGTPDLSAPRAPRPLLRPHQLDPRHRRPVALPLPELEDPRVPAVALGEPGPDLAEQLVDDVAVRDRP